jgi:nucleoside-diphosphate-sugar epimerase
MRILITGGSGYIGTPLLAAAMARGHEVVVLSRRRPAAPVQWFPWDLTAPVPRDCLAGIDAVLHLAHQWDSSRPEAEDENLIGTRALLAAARQAGIRRFVLASSISAREGALNRYGRLKWTLTSELTGTDEVAARIGLVYGGPRLGQWGTMCALAGKLAILPMIGTDKGIQPIHLDDLCEGLLRLAERSEMDRKTWGLADPVSVTFGAWLRLLARTIHHKRLIVVPLPLLLVLLAVRVVNALPLPIKVDPERVMGLAGITTIDSSGDLTALGLALRPVELALAAEGPGPRRLLLREGVILLRAVAGSRPRLRHLRAYARGVERFGGAKPLSLPTTCPTALRAFEPISGPADPTRLKGRLSMAFTIADIGAHGGATAYAQNGEGRVRAVLGLVRTLAVEGLLLPIRLILGRGR